MGHNSKSEFGILKSIWLQDSAGKWSMHGMQGIDLKPRQDYDPSYFKIDSDLKMLSGRPGPLTSNMFASFGTTEFLISQSIVPVVSWVEGDPVIRCIGTGFFVSASGLLITAAHVIRDPIDEKYATATRVDHNTHRLSDNLAFGILLPVNPALKNNPFFQLPMEVADTKCFLCPFEWTQHWGKEKESPLFNREPEFDLDVDIAICKVRQHPLVGPFQPLIIGQHRLKVGDQAVAVGYAEMQDLQLGAYEHPELVVSVGTVTAVHPDNITTKHNSTPGPNFEFSAKIPGRMSGSPILVGSGIVTKGVVSRSWQDENHASGCLVAAAMDLPIVGNKTLLQLQQEGNDGIAKISGSDL